MFRHATHLSRPNEQLKILRICLLIPVNSIIQLIGQLVPQAYFYIVPWADLMQALALGNFFLLLLEFISPHDNQRDFFFSGLQVPAKRSGRAPKNGLRWYRRKWLAIFQYPIVQLLVCVATDVTNSPRFNIYCANSNKPYFGHLWVSDNECSLLMAFPLRWYFYNSGTPASKYRLVRDDSSRGVVGWNPF